jgi:hypothetical protein
MKKKNVRCIGSLFRAKALADHPFLYRLAALRINWLTFHLYTAKENTGDTDEIHPMGLSPLFHTVFSAAS